MTDSNNNDPRATFARATNAYDAEHEAQLKEAIFAAIAEASLVSDANCMVFRTGECMGALLSCMALMLAMSPTVTRSPTAIRKAMDDLGKRLRRQVAAAEQNPDLREFLRRTFRNDGTEGNA